MRRLRTGGQLLSCGYSPGGAASAFATTEKLDDADISVFSSLTVLGPGQLTGTRAQTSLGQNLTARWSAALAAFSQIPHLSQRWTSAPRKKKIRPKMTAVAMCPRYSCQPVGASLRVAVMRIVRLRTSLMATPITRSVPTTSVKMDHGHGIPMLPVAFDA